jgi:hypothetical protein
VERSLRHRPFLDSLGGGAKPRSAIATNRRHDGAVGERQDLRQGEDAARAAAIERASGVKHEAGEERRR